MDSKKSFAMEQANRNKESMVFDWHKAAELIKDRSPKHVSAGLRDDWKYGCDIYIDGEVQGASYGYLASTWAVPEIDIDGQRFDCFIMQSESDGWNSYTYWPESAIAILKA